MIGDIVLNGIETTIFACGNICGKIVDVDRVPGGELKILNGDLVYFGLGFLGADGIGVDAVLEMGKHRVGIEDVILVETAGIGEDEEAVAGESESIDELGHGGVELEYLAPDSGELFTGTLEAEDTDGFGEEGVVVHLSGLEASLDGFDGVEDIVIHRAASLLDGLNGGGEIELEDDVADIE
jgi:hypothetical protein